MVKYQQRTMPVDEAFQWFKLGDHPNVEQYNVDFRQEQFRTCPYCGKPMEEHGTMEVTICPGDWVVVFPGYYVKAYSEREFHEKFEVV